MVVLASATREEHPIATFALIHGGGDVGWAWHLVQVRLHDLGHATVAPDLPTGEDTATLQDYADVVLAAIGERAGRLVVVGHSYGGFTAPIVAHRAGADLLVLLAPMIPLPGETPAQWWTDSGHAAATAGQPELDEAATFFHDVPPALAAESARRTEHRGESEAAYRDALPLPRWPDVPTAVIAARDDRLFPLEFVRRLAADRLGPAATVHEVAGGHYAMLATPDEVAALLHRLATDLTTDPTPGPAA